MRKLTADDFWARVEKTRSCWLWHGRTNGSGYGLFGHQGGAHRVAYELLIGPIPAGLTLDHLCRLRSCVNPAHLEPVSLRINILRGKGLSAKARKVHRRIRSPYDLKTNRLYLKFAFVERGLTIAGVARRVGYSRGHLSRVISGWANLEDKLARDIALATGIPKVIVLGEAETPTERPQGGADGPPAEQSDAEPAGAPCGCSGASQGECR